MYKEIKTPLYTAYPNNIGVLTQAEIEMLLLIYLNSNLDGADMIQELSEFLESYLIFKKGDTNEVVLRGNDILEAFLQENVEPCDCETNGSF